MATVDDEHGLFVVRVIYDGPPYSGKTTSLVSLARALGVDVVTPETDVDGRTLFFDWVEYVGGLFDGKRIRCQLVSVPGQRELGERRHVLLAEADVVVFVADTREEHFGVACEYLKELVTSCRARVPPVGIVVQANHRDSSSAVSRVTLDASLDAIAPLGVVESVATTGDGVRECFVFAIRLALDRAKAFRDTGLESGEVTDSPEALLKRLNTGGQEQVSVEVSEPAEVASPAKRSPRPVLRFSAPERAVLPSEADIPSGHLWPPVDGRIWLQQLDCMDVVPKKNTRGAWSAVSPGMRLYSEAAALYSESDARVVLRRWAGQHVASGSVLSPGRCLFLSRTDSGRFRVWQFVKFSPSYRDEFFDVRSMPELTTRLVEVYALLEAAQGSFDASAIQMPRTLWNVGPAKNGTPVLVGVARMPSSEPRPLPEANLSREFRSVLLQLETAQIGELIALLRRESGVASKKLLDLADSLTLND